LIAAGTRKNEKLNTLVVHGTRRYHVLKTLEGIVSKRKRSRYRSGRSHDWLKMKSPACAPVKREKEEDWGR
jgi:ATP-dependent DNA ligase